MNSGARRRVRPGLAALVALAAALGSCGRATQDGAGPVLLISIDTLSADRVGAWGSPSARTPEFDRLARAGIQVRDAISPAPLTLPSHATMLTGADPPVHGLRDNGLYRLGTHTPTIAQRLPDDVPKAGFIGGFPLVRNFGLGRGFDVWDDEVLAGATALRNPQRDAGLVLDAAARWLALREEGASPFAFVHLYDPHHPYEAPVPWADVTHRSGGDDYDAEVAWVDRRMRRFLASAAERPAAPRFVLVTADHGESLGAHGEPTHANFVYDATQRVPLALVATGVAARLETEPRRLAEVFGSILEAYGVAHDEPSLLDAASGRTAYVETMHTKLFKGWSPLHGARTSRWKYIRAPRPELYDLVADPGETANVHAAEPNVVDHLDAFVDSVLVNEHDAPSPGLTEDVREKLAALGYVDEGPQGAPSGKDPKDGIASSAALFLGQQAFLRDDLPAAEEQLLLAIAADPNLKDAHAYLSGVCLRTNRAEAAVRYAERALALTPHLNETPIRATLGEAYLVSGRPREAIAPLEIAVRANPSDGRVRALLARAREESP